MKIDRRSHTPLYIQIREQLRELFSAAGAEGSQYTEAELARQFGVNRLTVRQAVDDLVRDRLIYRVKGVGIFVSSPRPIEESAQELGHFFEEWHGQGREVRVEIRKLERVPATARVAANLMIKPGTEVLYIRRTRFVDGIPMVVDDRYIAFPWAEVLTKESMVGRTMHGVLKDRLGTTFAGLQVELEAGAAGREVAQDLKIRTGDPLMIRHSVLYGTDKSEALISGTSYYRADQYKWTAFVTKVR